MTTSPAVLPLRDVMTITSFGNRLRAPYKLQGVPSAPTRDLCSQVVPGERLGWSLPFVRSSVFINPAPPDCPPGLPSHFQKRFSRFYISAQFPQFSARPSKGTCLCLAEHCGAGCVCGLDITRRAEKGQDCCSGCEQPWGRADNKRLRV
uniref:Uncharacterized protein n=1 Tax=Molossus molossus TaxID=27622 RepID=A0A7J8E2M6_MOLMO|nr:hypothetical protein HJG59_008985 [Molossus molossus]